MTYLVFDPATHDAIVIDPVLDVDPASARISLESMGKLVARIHAQGRELRFTTTIEHEREGNIQLRATTSLEAFVAFRTARDRTLGAPRLLYPRVQVNIDAGRLPAPDDAGRRLPRIPIDLDPPI